MANDYIILGVGLFVIFSVGIGVINFTQPSEEKNKLEAQKIIDFRNAEHSCNELEKHYLKFEPKKYHSMMDLKWYHEARDKLIENDCIGSTELQNMEFIKMCMDSNVVGCEISKLENPELYDDFEFSIVGKDNENNTQNTLSRNGKP